MAKIGMIGAGSWGTALTWLLTNNGHQVTVWSALADEITMLQEKHEQTSKLPGVILDDSVVFTTDLKLLWRVWIYSFWQFRPRLPEARPIS